MPRQKAILIDIKRCVGCLSCETACKQLHGFGTEPEPTLSTPPSRWWKIAATSSYVRCACTAGPACASACLVGAINKTQRARWCTMETNASAAATAWSLAHSRFRATVVEAGPFVKKCDMCSERLKAGSQPACTEACPVQASTFGTRAT